MFWVKVNGGFMNEQEKAALERLLQSSLTGIEKKTIIERLTGRIVKDGDDFIQIDKESKLDEDGSIREFNIFSVRIYSCGCKSTGRSNFGGVDYRGNVVCNKHYYRCLRCRRALSILTVKPIDGICYCARCSRVVKFLRFLGLKK
jgi:hypothetical protein